METSIILSFIFTLNKSHYFIWIYHVTYYKSSTDFSWVDRYYQVVFTIGINIYIYIFICITLIGYTGIHLHLTSIPGV